MQFAEDKESRDKITENFVWTLLVLSQDTDKGEVFCLYSFRRTKANCIYSPELI